MNITALLDKLGGITEEQWKEVAAILDGKDMAALEAFCKKHGIELAAEERDAAAEYFKTGKLPLGDEEMENVAGGGICSMFTAPKPEERDDMMCPYCFHGTVIKDTQVQPGGDWSGFSCLQCRRPIRKSDLIRETSF